MPHSDFALRGTPTSATLSRAGLPRDEATRLFERLLDTPDTRMRRRESERTEVAHAA